MVRNVAGLSDSMARIIASSKARSPGDRSPPSRTRLEVSDGGILTMHSFA